MPAISFGYGWKIGVCSANWRDGGAGEMPDPVSELTSIRDCGRASLKLRHQHRHLHFRSLRINGHLTYGSLLDPTEYRVGRDIVAYQGGLPLGSFDVGRTRALK
jgi:hypothetical protein